MTDKSTDLAPFERIVLKHDDDEVEVARYADGAIMLKQGDDHIYLSPHMIERVASIANWRG